MSQLADLAGFLRARRDQLEPDHVGHLDSPFRRRVPRLRREEVAQRASISVDYYTRLEQGRAPHVSPGILAALSHAMELTADEARYLRNVAVPAHQRASLQALSAVSSSAVRPMLQRTVMAMGSPAILFGRCAEILAVNPLGRALYLDSIHRATTAGMEANAARMLFLDPHLREMFPEFDEVAAEMVGSLRAEAGRRPDDPDLARLIEDLSAASVLFSSLWGTHDVREKAHGMKLIRHPVVGDMLLHYEALRVADDPDQVIMVYSAEPGSADQAALDQLSVAS